MIASRLCLRSLSRHAQRGPLRDGLLPALTVSPISLQIDRTSFSSKTASVADGPSKPKDLESVQPTFYVPRADRDEHRSVFDVAYVTGETRLARNSRTCPTRELYFQHAQWGRHKSPYRKLRHMASLFDSAAFQRLIFPDLLSITAISACVTYYNEVLVAADAGAVAASVSPSAFAGATTAIGLLVGFRLNNSYKRISDGRKIWSSINTSTRDISRMVLMWMNAHPESQTRMLRLCQAFPVALMFYTNDKGSHFSMKRRSKPGEPTFEERVYAEYRAELCDLYGPFITENQSLSLNDMLKADLERLCRSKKQKGSMALEVLICMSEVMAEIGSQTNPDDPAYVHPVFLREIEEQIRILGKALGSSERISKTPLPTGFTRHSSRLLFIWSSFLPLALYPLMGPVGTLPTSLLTAYAVLGIEDISVQLEEPFDILPLREYSDSMYSSINMIEQGFKKPSIK